jgi:hypothetical protein
MTDPIMPLFAFKRSKHVEQECGFSLAGQLIVDIPKKDIAKKHSQQTIVAIFHLLEQLAESNRLPDGRYITVYGWPGGSKPIDAADTDDDALTADWAARSIVIALRLGGAFGDNISIDTDSMAQMMGTPPSRAAN